MTTTVVNAVRSKNNYDSMWVEVIFANGPKVKMKVARSSKSVATSRDLTQLQARTLLRDFCIYMDLKGTGLNNGQRMAMIEEFARTAKDADTLSAFLSVGPKVEAKAVGKDEPEVAAAKARTPAQQLHNAAKARAAATPATKYTYAAGMSDADKRKMRAAARRAAKGK